MGRKGEKKNRGERIRTSDLTDPNRARYQPALHPDEKKFYFIIKRFILKEGKLKIKIWMILVKVEVMVEEK